MPVDVKIESFSPPYEDQIFDLILPIQIDEFGIQITRKNQPDLSRIPEFYQERDGNFWVAVLQGGVVGSIGLKDIGNRQVALRKMFVHASYRGKDNGVAQKLLNESFAWARARKKIDIFLGTTAEFLAAHRFYEKNGFVEIDREELPPAFPIMAVDTKFYHLRLK